MQISIFIIVAIFIMSGLALGLGYPVKPVCKKCKIDMDLVEKKDPFAISITPYFSIPWFRFPFLGRNVRYVYRCPHCGRKRTIVQKERDMP